MKNLSKNPSIKTLGNKNNSSYWSKSTKNNQAFSTIKGKQNSQFLEKSFNFHTTKSINSKDQQHSLNRVVSLSNFSENQSVNHKPLDDLLKSSKQSSFHGMKKSQRSQIKYETNNSQTQADKRICEINNDQHVSNFNTNQHCQSGFDKNPSFIKLEQDGRRVKTLQNETNNSKSRSRSIKRKGLECTLYERSLQKEIQGSGIKSNIKLTTVKKKLQKTEGKSEVSNQIFKKDPKKVVLRKKTKESEGFTQLESFNSINLNSTINKKCDESFQTIKIALKSLSKVQENIRSVSKHKRTALNELNRSMSAIKQVCANYKFDSTKKRSVEKKARQTMPPKPRSFSKSLHAQLTQPPPLPNTPPLNQPRIHCTLSKIHSKYTFITNYLSDIDILGRLNSYDIAGKQQCKWVLLLIDEVYEMIRHSRENKLKGMDYSREYQYCSLQMIE